MSFSQHTQFKLAEMVTDLTASRLLVRHAARAVDDKDENAAILAAMAKLQATDKCFNVGFLIFFLLGKVILILIVNLYEESIRFFI